MKYVALLTMLILSSSALAADVDADGGHGLASVMRCDGDCATTINDNVSAPNATRKTGEFIERILDKSATPPLDPANATKEQSI